MTALRRILLTMLLMVLAPAAALADGGTIVTVMGEIEKTNRGPLDPKIDRFFAYHDVKFDKALALDRQALAALPQVTIKADFPKGAPPLPFRGPLLASVLDAAGAKGTGVLLVALDGYAVELSRAEIAAQKPVLALERDGRPLGLGDFGPTMIVFPRLDDPALAAQSDKTWIFSVYRIEVR